MWGKSGSCSRVFQMSEWASCTPTFVADGTQRWTSPCTWVQVVVVVVVGCPAYASHLLSGGPNLPLGSPQTGQREVHGCCCLFLRTPPCRAQPGTSAASSRVPGAASFLAHTAHPFKPFCLFSPCFLAHTLPFLPTLALGTGDPQSSSWE